MEYEVVCSTSHDQSVDAGKELLQVGFAGIDVQFVKPRDIAIFSGDESILTGRRQVGYLHFMNSD